MTKQKQSDEHETVKEAAQKFSKEQLLRCSRFRDIKDLINALLSDAKAYTIAEAEDLINHFYGKEVH